MLEGKKIYCPDVDTYLNRYILEELRNDHLQDQDPNLISGTFKYADPLTSTPPNGVKKIFLKNKVKFINKAVRESDVVVIDLHCTPVFEAEQVVNQLKDNFHVHTTIILLSSLMTWYNTPKKTMADGGDGDEQEDDKEGEERPEDLNTILKELYGEMAETNEKQAKEIIDSLKKTYNVKDIEKLKRQKVQPFTEDDYPLRSPMAGFEELKLFETRCMNLSNKYNHLSCYVVGCGVAYGHGEDLLYEWFKQAWLQEPSALKIMNEGFNHIPTVHVVDIARLVKKIITTKPTKQYILAVDKTIYGPQGRDGCKAYNLISTISKNVGSGLVEMVPAESLLDNPRYSYMLIDLFFKPSDLMYIETDGDDEPVNDEEEKKEKLFDWYAEYGLAANIEQIRQDFNKYRGLSNIKVLISGPLATGKTVLAQKLAEFYNLPYISIENVIVEWMAGDYEPKALDPDNDPYVESREVVSKYKEELDAYLLGQQDKKKKDKKGASEKPKLPDDIILLAYKWKLRQNACLNRGFILDNYPKTYAHCRELFMDKKKVENDDDDEKFIEELNPTHMPQKLYIMAGTDGNILQRVKTLQSDKYLDSAYVDRRLKLYKTRNEDEAGVNTPLSYFFKEHGREFTSFEVFQGEGKEAKDIDELALFEAMKLSGEHVNFRQVETEFEHFLTEKEIELQNEALEKHKEAKAENEDKMAEGKDMRKKVIEQKKEQIRESEVSIIENKSVALRTYLTDNVMEKLTDGLVEVCKAQPDDPVDFLAEFLFKEGKNFRSRHN